MAKRQYSILQNDAGKWQILRKSHDGTYWIIEVPNVGSRKLGSIMLRALNEQPDPELVVTDETTTEDIARAASEDGIIVLLNPVSPIKGVDDE